MIDRKSASATFFYALLQISTWSFYAILMSFSGNVLRHFGFDDSHISLLMGMASLLALGGQLIIGELGGKYPNLKVSYILIGLGIVMLLGSLVVRFSPLPVFVSVIAYGLCCVIVHLVPHLANALGMDAIRRGSPTNYSLARATGSLGYSFFAYLTGTLVKSRGVMAVPLVAASSALILICSVFLYKRCAVDHLPEIAPEEMPKKKKGRDGAFLRKYPRFALFLVGAVFLQIAHGLINNFMFQIMQHKNGTAAQQGIAAAICAFSEIPIMLSFPFLLRKLHCDRWLRIAAMCMLLKPLGTLLAGSPQTVYIAQATQLVGYGLYAISSVNYAELLVEKGESVQAQSYLGTSVTAGSLIALFSGGVLCQHLGVSAMIFISCACSLLGGLFVVFTAQKTRA